MSSSSSSSSRRSSSSRLPSNLLPDQFPEGTKYVIEGRAGLIPLEYVEFPDGRRVDLISGKPTRTSVRRPCEVLKATAKKYSTGRGTPARLAS